MSFVKSCRGCLRTFATSTIKHEKKLNKYSSIVTGDPSQGASQAMLYATGFSDEDFDRAQIALDGVEQQVFRISQQGRLKSHAIQLHWCVGRYHQRY